MGNTNKQFDFEGWATKNDLRCADGLVIRKGAFTVNDGKRVPLVWNHRHDTVSEVLGHAILENRDDGVWAYGYFNKTQAGQDAKEAVKHGDVTSMSIWANNLQKNGPDVMHGVIREVSLVLAGANPGAFIESVMVHNCPIDEDEEEGLFYTGENFLVHAEEVKKEEEKPKDKEKESSGETVADVYNTLNEKQKEAVAIIVGQAIADARSGEDEEGDEKEMRHNLFEGSGTEEQNQPFLSHSDIDQIFKDAKQRGSLREAFYDFAKSTDNEKLMHAIDTTGMDVATGTQTYGFNDPEMLFPEFRNLNNPPEWLSRDMGWVTKVLGGVHRSPFSRIKSQFANITEDEARAKGYIKGKQKKDEVFSLLKRSTTPTTIYKRQKLDRDDIIDITDFDVVSWIRAEMRVMLNEEIARAILIGDGRPSSSDDKIQPLNIRPIVEDDPLFNVVVEVSPASDEDYAKTIINAAIRSRKQYKGSGTPDFYTTEDVVTEMLLLEDGIGHKLYKTEQELSTALRARSIVTVEVMEGHKLSDGRELIGTFVNLVDYNVGTDKGGAVALYDDFDINFNQYIYLIETRLSGALIKPYSALTLVKPAKKPTGGGTTTE